MIEATRPYGGLTLLSKQNQNTYNNQTGLPDRHGHPVIHCHLLQCHNFLSLQGLHGPRIQLDLRPLQGGDAVDRGRREGEEVRDRHRRR